MRKCTKCKKIKDLDSFHLKVDGKLGKKSHCKVCVKAYDKKRSVKKSLYDSKRYIENKNSIKKQNKNYYEKNKEKYRNYEIQRSRLLDSKISRMYKKENEMIYKKCRELNIENKEYHVDHIIPIKNEIICGLHVPWNLQIIKKEDNLKKSNKLLTEEELEGIVNYG